MLKMDKKLLVSLVMVITLMVMVFGSIQSLAATTIKPATNESSDTNTNTNTEANTQADDSSVGAATNSNTNTNKNTNTNTNTNKNSANNAGARNTNSASSLPYAGTNTTIVFVVIALVASALYAYKKVSDYNV